MASTTASSLAEIKEAHRIKSISFLGSPRHILLQNKNGPCPLLAAANALLLRGTITLPGRCISAGEISIDDVINLLAERAVARTGEHCALAATSARAGTFTGNDANGDENAASRKGDDEGEPAAATVSSQKDSGDGASNNEGIEADVSSASADAPPSPESALPAAPPKEPELSPRAAAAIHAQHHLHEVLSLFPSLQYGLDVNPKFTAGPTGVEFTSNLTCFDLLGIELVHGWLLDPQDVESVSVIGDKTYNELVELVIQGNEAGEEVEKLGKTIAAKEAGVEIAIPLVRGSTSTADHETKTADETNANLETNEEGDKPSAAASAKNNTPQQMSKEELRVRHREKSSTAHEGHVVNSFLTSTSHQLTYHGLAELHNHLSNHSLCVFFRNNHFATLTKEDDALFLLVTDLGYANVPEVVWEKLDAIDGATTLFDEYFAVPEPRTSMGANAGPTLSSEDVAGQSGQVDADHQLALQLSKHTGGDGVGGNSSAANTKGAREEQEGRLMAAATEASIQDWHKAKAKERGGGYAEGVVAVGVPSAPPAGTVVEIPGSKSQSGVGEGTAQKSIPAPGQGEQSSASDQASFVPSDEQIARALQAQMNSDHESEALARRLQAEEDSAARQRRTQQQRPAGGASASTSRPSAEDKSNCVVS